MSRAWMPLYVADYLADTAHLNAAQSGAYLHLIMHYWQTGGLPKDDVSLRRIARMTNRQWFQNRDLLKSFFEDDWKHKRVDSELQKTAELSEKRRASAEQMHSKRSANAKQMHTQSQSPLSPNGDNNKRASPRDELLTVLDAEHAEAVIAHRKALRKPLTQRAAKMLAGNFSQTSDPNAAADLMISRGWQGFEPEWMHNDERSVGTEKRSNLDGTLSALAAVTERRIAERERQMDSPRCDTGTEAPSVDAPEIIPFRPPERFTG